MTAGTGWASKEQAALSFECTTRTIDRYISQGIVSVRRNGGKRVEVRLSDLETMRDIKSDPSPELRAMMRKIVDVWPNLTPGKIDQITQILN